MVKASKPKHDHSLIHVESFRKVPKRANLSRAQMWCKLWVMTCVYSRPLQKMCTLMRQQFWKLLWKRLCVVPGSFFFIIMTQTLLVMMCACSIAVSVLSALSLGNSCQTLLLIKEYGRDCSCEWQTWLPDNHETDQEHGHGQFPTMFKTAALIYLK